MIEPPLNKYFWPNPDIPKSAKCETLDKEFEEKWKMATPEETQKMKDDACLLFWRFKPIGEDLKLENPESKPKSEPESEKTKTEEKKEPKQIEKTEEKIDLSKFKENPNYPILKRFTEIQWKDWNKLESTQLDNEELKQISELMEKSWWENSMKYLKENLNKIEFKNPNKKNYLSSYITQIDDLNKDKTKTKQEGWKELLELPEEFKKNDTLNNQNDDITQLLAKNYTKFPDTNWKPNFEKDILTTFEITANKVIEWKNFPRNVSFDLAMKDVKNWDIETRYNALSYINSLVNTAEWLKWTKSSVEYKEMKWKHNDKKQKYLDFKITKLNEQLLSAKEKWDNKKVFEIQEQLQKLEKQKSSWDVFESWELDKIAENEPWSPKEQA